MALLSSFKMDPKAYLDLKRALMDNGYFDEIEWAETVKPPEDAFAFWREYTWVICNSGMKNQIAQKIFKRILESIGAGGKARDVFGHKGKSGAIDRMSCSMERHYGEYMTIGDDYKVDYCKSLPWIGDITKYHLAKNLGVDCAKPDRHLARIAGKEGTHAMCKRLSDIIGDRIATVDVVIWRAANLGMV